MWGSPGTVYATRSFPIALRISTKVSERKAHSPFQPQDKGFSIEEDDVSAIFENAVDTAPAEVDEIPEPKKVAKKKEVAAPSNEEDDLSALVDDWDD